MDQSNQAIKTVFRNDIRRFQLSSPSWDTLTQALRGVYPALADVTNARLSVRYEDDENEKITIGAGGLPAQRDAELAEAFSIATQQKRSALKLFVDLLPATQPSVGATWVNVAQAEADISNNGESKHQEEDNHEAKGPLPTEDELVAIAATLVGDQSALSSIPKALDAVVGQNGANDGALFAQNSNPRSVVEAVFKAAPELRPHLERLVPYLDHSKVSPVLLQLLQKAKECGLPCVAALRPMLDQWLPLIPIMFQQLLAMLPVFKAQAKAWFDQACCQANDAGAAAGNAAGAAAHAAHAEVASQAAQFAAMGPILGQVLGSFLPGATAAGPALFPLFGQAMRVPSTAARGPVVDSNENKGAGEGVHKGIHCDMCKQSPIKGDRYKCTRCPDFDMCSACEAKNEHPFDHPLLKMRPTPPVAPKPKGPTVHTNVICDGCGATPITGVRWHCSVCPDFDLCEACEGSGDKHDPNHPLLKIREAKPVQQPKRGGCGRGNRHPNWRRNQAPTGNPFLRALRGHSAWGQGPPCVRRNAAQQPPVAHPVKQAGGAQAKLSAKFVKDETIPDRSEVAGGQALIKQWTVINDGTHAWPARSKLVFLRGDRELSAHEEFEIPECAPGARVTISALLNTPVKQGRYMAYYRLAGPDRTPFGPRLWVDLHVFVPNKPVQPMEEAKREDEKEEEVDATAVPLAVPVPIPTSPATDDFVVVSDEEDAINAFAAAAAAAVAVEAAAPAEEEVQWSLQQKMLEAMGFSPQATREALSRFDGNVMQAANHLTDQKN